MSTSTALHPRPVSLESNEEVPANSVIRPRRSDRSAAKGRRRRAAAEQRRLEQRGWSQLMHEDEEEIFVAPRHTSRRQARRAARHLARDEFDDCLLDENDLDLAFAVSLSLSGSAPNFNGDGQSMNFSSTEGGFLDMSYENLVLLENVKCAASPATVNSLSGYVFHKSDHNLSGSVDELCTICQNEYEVGNSLMLLPCMHSFHDVCGSEWLLNHSKLCPVCKHDVTENV